MSKKRFIITIVVSTILLIVTWLSWFAQSLVPYDWFWTIREELRIQSNSKIDAEDSGDLTLLQEEWDKRIRPFIDIDNYSFIESIEIHIIHPLKRKHIFPVSWRKTENYGMDSYLRDNADYIIKITGAKQINFMILLLATAPVYEKPYDKNYDQADVSGVVIDMNMSFPKGERKTYIMVYDKENVFYEKGTDLSNRVYRKMPEVLLENFTLSYSEAVKQFRKNLKNSEKFR